MSLLYSLGTLSASPSYRQLGAYYSFGTSRCKMLAEALVVHYFTWKCFRHDPPSQWHSHACFLHTVYTHTIGDYSETCTVQILTMIWKHVCKAGRWDQTGGSRKMYSRAGLPSRGQATEMSQISEIQQGQLPSSAPGREKSLATVQAGDALPGEQLCWEVPGHLSWQEAEHKSAVCPGRKETNNTRGCKNRIKYWSSPSNQYLLGIIQNTASSFAPVQEEHV